MELAGLLVDSELVRLLIADIATTADAPVVQTVTQLRELGRLLELADVTDLRIDVEITDSGIDIAGVFDPLPGVSGSPWPFDLTLDDRAHFHTVLDVGPRP